ncbi:MAG TPA: efflux RND transporter periplasmic adaptor subunit [Bryobacteraceae bacterium]|nr:efflux RND transporter periplasmic adaptor subunit [Bryobacteraceae bacterium]
MKKVIIRLVILMVVAGAVWSGYRLFQSMPQRQQQIATTKVRRGDVVVRSFTRGELRAVRSATLIAPNLFGTVQVTQLAQLGSFAREKDLVVEFDDSEVNSRLEEKQLEIDQVDEQVKKAQADLAIRNNQDQVELLRARYSVRRAELEVKRNELISAIDARKNLLNLEEARRRLRQLESDIKSRLEQAQAEMAVLTEKKRKSQMELGRERQRLAQVKLLAPMSGLVAVKQNRPNFMFPGVQIPDFREGDQVQPGVAVAEILDLSELELVAKVGELDRANLKEGQDVKIQLDAVGDKSFTGKIKTMSGTASANIFSSDPAKKFDVVFSIDMKQLLTGLGAKPEQIRKVLETQEQNRKKPVPAQMPMTMASMGGAPGGPPPGGAAPEGVQGAGAPAPGPGGMPGEGAGRQMMIRPPGGASRAGATGPDSQKMNEAVQKALKGRKLSDLSPEERSKVMAEAMKSAPGAGGKPGPGAAPGGRMAGNRGPGGEDPAMAMMGMLRSQFSQKDMENAKLPAPPEADNNLDVLMRPGLLADVEIILEKIPNAINIPAQAVFEKDGNKIVYVRNNNKWEERIIKPLKRTESTMVIASGLKAGETIAMADPNVKPGDKKKDKGSNGGGPMGGMPAGGGK